MMAWEENMIQQTVQQLIEQALAVQLIEKEDEIYVRNQVLSLLQLTEFSESVQTKDMVFTIPDLLEEITAYACTRGIIEDLYDEKEIFSSKIMNCFLDRPSVVNQQF